jgi:hypothetical protein
MYDVKTICLSAVEQFDLMLSTDGSGRGAALVAAVLKNQAKFS